MQSLALTIPLIAAAAAAPNGPVAGPVAVQVADESDAIGRRLDLRALDTLLPDLAEAHETASFPVLPLTRMIPSRPDEMMGSDGESRNLPSRVVADLIVNYYGEGLRVIESVSDGVYYVAGDEATVDSIEAFAQHIVGAATGAPRVRITRLRGGADGAARIRAGAGLSEVGALLSVREATLVPGIPTRCSDIVSDTIVAAPSVEIAQGVAIVNPDVEEAASGVDLVLSCRRENDGVRLTYTLAHTERMDVARSKGVTASALFGSDRGAVELFERMGWNESYGVQGGAIGAETFVRPGQRAVLSGKDGELIVLEVVSGAKRREFEDFAMPDDHTLVMFERASVSAPSLVPGGKLLRQNYVLDHSTWGLSDEGSQSLFTAWKSPLETPFEIMWSAVDVYPDTHWLPGISLGVTDRESAARLRPWFTFMATGGAAPLEVNVSRIRGGERDMIGTFESSAGSESVVSFGSEELVSKDNDVEVAQYAGIEQPRVVTHFQGFAGAVQLSVLPGGRLAYEVRGQISQDGARTERSRTIDTAGGATAIQARHVTLDERGVVDAGQDGRWRIILGDGSGNGPGVELAVAPRR